MSFPNADNSVDLDVFDTACLEIYTVYSNGKGYLFASILFQVIEDGLCYIALIKFVSSTH